MKRIIKIAAVALCAAILCLSSVFAQDPLQCTVSVPNALDFGNIRTYPGQGGYTWIYPSIECNRTPKYPINVWISLGSYSRVSELSRNMKRDSPSSENYIEYKLSDGDGHAYYNIDGPSIALLSSCFVNGKCTFRVYGKFAIPQSYPEFNFYAGHYSDPNLIIRVRYSSEY